MLQGTQKRTAMTLVELLVVMAIIVIFTAMTAAFYPANQADRELSRFSNTVQSALLSARNRAKAERLPTGIRFYDLDANGRVDSVVLIQKPAPLDAYAVGGGGNPPTAGSLTVTMSGIDAYIAFPNSYSVQGNIKINDFITLESGDVAKIDGLITPPTMANPNTVYSLGGNPLIPMDVTKSYSSGFSSALTLSPTKFKVYRSAVELSGDTPFELSNTIEVQMPTTVGSPLDSFTSAYCFLASLPPPTNRVYPFYMDIIFNPDGSLNNSTSEVYLHLHNFEALAGDYSRDAILAVRKMSGSIGVYEVGQPIDFTNPTDILKHNPTLFAKDPRNKGI